MSDQELLIRLAENSNEIASLVQTQQTQLNTALMQLEKAESESKRAYQLASELEISLQRTSQLFKNYNEELQSEISALKNSKTWLSIGLGAVGVIAIGSIVIMLVGGV